VVAADADPVVTVLVGGRVKHMTHAMNDVLRGSFAEVTAGLGRQKSRVLTAREQNLSPEVYLEAESQIERRMTEENER